MADEEQLAVLRQGRDAWNAWREQNPDVRVDLRQAGLSGADLFGANLNEAKLFRTFPMSWRWSSRVPLSPSSRSL